MSKLRQLKRMKPVKRSRNGKVANLLKLDLGCGRNKHEGFHGVDFTEDSDADTVHDLMKFPWPFGDESVGEVWCSHFFEHVPGLLRGKWMDELYRVMAFETQASIIVPYGLSARAYQDFTHAFPPVVQESFLYFNKPWREANKLTHGHYDLKCDFDYTGGGGLNGEWPMKEQSVQQFAIVHYNNVVSDIQIVLTKVKRP